METARRCAQRAKDGIPRIRPTAADRVPQGGDPESSLGLGGHGGGRAPAARYQDWPEDNLPGAGSGWGAVADSPVAGQSVRDPGQDQGQADAQSERPLAEGAHAANPTVESAQALSDAADAAHAAAMKAKGYADAGGDAAQIAAAGMAVAYAGSALTMADTKLAAAKAAMSADEAATASALTVAEDVLIPKKTSTETFDDSVVAISRTTEGRSVTVGSGETKFSPSDYAPQAITGWFGQMFGRSDTDAGSSKR